MVIYVLSQKQSNHLGLIPANGISPNFSTAQKFLSDSNNYFIKILAVWQELLPYAVTKYIPKGRHFASITVEFSPLVLADATGIPAELKMVMLFTDSQ